MGWCDGARRSAPLETILLIPNAGLFTCRVPEEWRNTWPQAGEAGRWSSGVDVWGRWVCGTLALVAAACMSMHMGCLDEV